MFPYILDPLHSQSSTEPKVSAELRSPRP